MTDPTPDELQDPVFDAIWQTIKRWDIGHPSEASGTYRGAIGNDAAEIYRAVKATGREKHVEWPE